MDELYSWSKFRSNRPDPRLPSDRDISAVSASRIAHQFSADCAPQHDPQRPVKLSLRHWADAVSRDRRAGTGPPDLLAGRSGRKLCA
jgi:hypothetical protein